MVKQKTGWRLESSYIELPDRFYSRVEPNPVRSPQLVVFNDELAESLGLDPEMLKREEGVAVLAGNASPEGSAPFAQAYAGHQFGSFVNLGDGRAMLIGEQVTPGGKRVDVQLKGSGRTPYSRGGDGRAALGPMLREYIISEAMHALGIPTTRSLAVVATGEVTLREEPLPGAVLTRTAASHLRVGTFQYAAALEDRDALKALADYAIGRHYPESAESDNPYLALFRNVAQRQAALIAKWQLAGFVHGVMNTDNMTISGETIDYGPCAFMNAYDPATVFSSIDIQGRYAYGNQPSIGGWNLARFAEALLPLIHEDAEQAAELCQAELEAYIGRFQSEMLEGMRAKLGLFNKESGDEALIDALLKMMREQGADYTNTFRALSSAGAGKPDLFESNDFKEWQAGWQERLGRQEAGAEEAAELMRRSNPAVIPRNHRVEEALEAAGEGDLTVLNRLLAVLRDPYAYTEEQDAYASPPPPSDRPYRTYCGT